MLIYQIVHIDSGHKYVGQTSRPPKKRWCEHLYLLRKRKHSNSYLQYAWTKYGESSFRFEIVKECNSLEELNKLEIELIVNGTDIYNLGPGGCDHTHDIKTKKAIGESNKKPIMGMCIKTGNVKEYASAADAISDGFNEKCIRKCVLEFTSTRKNGESFKSISHKGWVWMEKDAATTEKLREKSEIAKRAKIRAERKVIGMNVFTKEIKEFVSSAEASRNGFNITAVHNACKGRIRVHRGFVWTFGDIDKPQSLLEEKVKRVFTNPPRGPKSWQF